MADVAVPARPARRPAGPMLDPHVIVLGFKIVAIELFSNRHDEVDRQLADPRDQAPARQGFFDARSVWPIVWECLTQLGQA